MSRLRLLVILSVLSIIGILAVQAVWVRNAYALRERQFRQSAFIALQDVADDVAKLNHFTLNRYAVTQLSADYFIVNTDAPIDPATLELFIQRSLQQHNLITDYEYGIYNCESDRMVYGAYIGTSSSALTKGKPQAGKTLPKFPRYTYYFGIRFPNQTAFVAGQLDGWVWSTVAVLLVVSFFGYTLSVVLKQRRLTEVQRDFINNITHELQTPVSTIRIAADVLQSETITQQPDRLKQYARVLGEESRRLQKQVNSILQLARSERTGFVLDKVDVEFHDVIRDAAVNFPYVALDLTAPDAQLQADRYQLETALNNLIDNALKYCTRSPCVVLHTRLENSQLIWSVRDNGIGIAQKDQKAIFRQFFRVASGGHTHNVKGFGLGLYYVQQVVRAHGWQLTLYSELGKGSQFEIMSECVNERKGDSHSVQSISWLRSFTHSLFHL